MTEANIRELKNIVKSFRVSELQMLLEFAGRMKVGRKQELLERALSLIDKGCPTSIVVKINDLNRRRGGHLPIATTSSLLSVKPSASGAASIPRTVQQMSSEKTPALNEGEASIPSTSSHSMVPVHPDVRMKPLAFYDVIAELVKPSSLSPKGMSRFHENTFTFHLTPQQTNDICASRELIDDCVIEYGIQVLLRFCLMETTSEQEDNFPSNISVRVNDKIAALPNPIPTNKPGVEPKRPGRPVNITHICILSPTSANVINVTWVADPIRNFCLSVYLARHLNSNILMMRLKQNGIRHPDHTRALIKEKLASNSDSEIATTSLRISLLCPIGKMRMTVPSRSLLCNHLQCFDAPTFIQMNEKKPTWTCPVCDKPADFKTLIIDGLFSEILVKAHDSNDIQFTADGNWCHIQPKEEEVKVEDESLLVETITDSPVKSDNVEMIDLTASDDEDDIFVKSRPGSSYSVEICSNPGYSEPLSFNSMNANNNHSEVSFSSARPSDTIDSVVPDINLPPELTLHGTSHLISAGPLFPIHDTPPALLPFGEIWDYHTVPSASSLDQVFHTSGFMSSEQPLSTNNGSSSIAQDLENSFRLSESVSQSLHAALERPCRTDSATSDVISLD